MNMNIVIYVLMSCVRLAGDVSEPGLCPAEEEPDLLSSHQRRENPSGRDPRPARAAVQEEGLSVHRSLHLTGAGEGTRNTWCLGNVQFSVVAMIILMSAVKRRGPRMEPCGTPPHEPSACGSRSGGWRASAWSWTSWWRSTLAVKAGSLR